MSLGIPEIITLSTMAAGVATLSLGLWRMAQSGRMAAAARPQTDIANLIRDGENRLTSLVAMMDANHQAYLENLRSEISAVKADIDWLTGEKMIEQAISMAREGVAAEDISADLGLSFDAAHTISVMRRH